jgi:hypothetical protein
VIEQGRKRKDKGKIEIKWVKYIKRGQNTSIKWCTEGRGKTTFSPGEREGKQCFHTDIYNPKAE